MRAVLTARQMKACDEATIQKMGMPSAVLMERAALVVRDVINERYPQAGRILVLCGSGNNGGDGFAVARLLQLEGRQAQVLFIGSHDRMTEETTAQERIFRACGGIVLPDEAPVKDYDLIVDALFGIGLSRDIIGRYADLVRAVNLSGTPVVAVDIPSGVNADDGRIMGCAVRAELTVTFAFAKRGQLLFPGAAYCGEVLVRDIGITDAGLQGIVRKQTEQKACSEDAADECLPDKEGIVQQLEYTDLKAMLPARSAFANKGTYGKLLLIGGRKDMAGAMVLAGRSAYRTGCGLVCIVSAPENREILQSSVPEAVFAPCDEDLDRWLAWADAIAVGPGLGQLPESAHVLEKVLSNWTGPLVLDADALNLIAACRDAQSSASAEENVANQNEVLRISKYDDLAKALYEREQNRNAIPQAIITPHPGEMARLLQADGLEASALSVAAQPLAAARQYAAAHGCVTVLKGARTVIADGEEICLNTFGNEGMATGGSGDVLTGIIGSLLAQGLTPAEAARAGVLLHALAGDAAAQELGTRSLTAGAISDFLPAILKNC